MLTWAFEFEDQPYFDGFRTLATNGVDKPVLNVFRMAGMMGGDRVTVDRAMDRVDLDTMVNERRPAKPDVDALASRVRSSVAVLVWNYHDDDVSRTAAPTYDCWRHGIPPKTQARSAAALSASTQRTATPTASGRQMGSPQNPTAEQYRNARSRRPAAAARVARIGSTVQDGAPKLHFALPLQGVSLVELSW